MWKEVRDACTIDREGMERDERRNGGGRKWELGLEGIMGKEKKAKGKVGDGKGEEVEANTKRVKFEHIKPEKLAGSPKGSPRDTGGGGSPVKLCMHALSAEFGVGQGCKRQGCRFTHVFRGLKKAAVIAAVKECPIAGIDKDKVLAAVARSNKF